MSSEAPPSDPSYPRYFQTIVGVAPDKVRYFTAEDVAMLVAVFVANVGVDPLQTTRPLKEIVQEALAKI